MSVAGNSDGKVPSGLFRPILITVLLTLAISLFVILRLTSPRRIKRPATKALAHWDYAVSLVHHGTLQMGRESPGMGRMSPPKAPAGFRALRDDSLHEVELTTDFYFGRFEVSQRDWKAVMGERPDPLRVKCIDCPVEEASWLDAVALANAASQKNGLQLCYDMTQVTTVRRVPECHGYRLPTEAEWEFVAQREIRESDLNNKEWVAENAVVASNSGGSTRPRVRGALLDGIFDLAGNVNEWVWDAYGAYSTAKATDPMGTAQSGRRVIRGCGYETQDVTTCAPTFRRAAPPETKSQYVGFRLLCTASPQSCGGGRS
jgi:formylglycine-generating enzyme required for sulfatase activity